MLGAIRDRRIITWDTDVDLGMLEIEKKKLSRAINELKKKGFHVFYDDILDRLIIMRFGRRINISFNKWMAGGKYAYAKMGTAKFYVIIAGLSSVQRLMLIPQREYLDYRLKLELMYYWPSLYRFLRLISIIPFKVRMAISRIIKLIRKILVKFTESKFIAFVVPSYHFREFNTIEFYGTKFRVPSDTEKYLERHYGREWKTPQKDWHWLKDDGTLKIIHEHS